MRERVITASGLMEAGQDLVAAGYIALKGTSAVATQREKELLQRFTPQFVRRCQNLYETRGLLKLPGLSASEGAGIFRNAGLCPGALPERAALWRPCGIILTNLAWGLR